MRNTRSHESIRDGTNKQTQIKKKILFSQLSLGREPHLIKEKKERLAVFQNNNNNNTAWPHSNTSLVFNTTTTFSFI
jgi:hypothetical protein